MLFPSTRQKLLRCEELLGLLSQEAGNPGAFDALLDSLVNQGRSVTFVLQKEIARVRPRMGAWYAQEQERMALPENNALPWLNSARTLTTHEEPLGVARQLEMKFKNPPVLRPGEKVILTKTGDVYWERFDDAGKPYQTRVTEAERDIRIYPIILKPIPPNPLLLSGENLTGKDAYAVAFAYLAYLRDLLNRAELEALKGG